MRVSDTIEALRPAVEVQTGGTDSAFEYQTLEKVWELLTGETIKDPLTQIYSPTVTISTVYDRCNGTYIRTCHFTYVSFKYIMCNRDYFYVSVLKHS